jgi:hypothetical protein
VIAKPKAAAPGTREQTFYKEFKIAARATEAASTFARVPREERVAFRSLDAAVS